MQQKAYIYPWKNEKYPHFIKRRTLSNHIIQTISSKRDIVYYQEQTITLGTGHASQQGALSPDVYLKTTSIRASASFSLKF